MHDLFIMPVPGRLARHPETGEPVPAGGLAVPRSAYWLRRLKDGDVKLASEVPLDRTEGVTDGDQL